MTSPATDARPHHDSQPPRVVAVIEERGRPGEEGHLDTAICDDDRGVYALLSAQPPSARGREALDWLRRQLCERLDDLAGGSAALASGAVFWGTYRAMLESTLGALGEQLEERFPTPDGEPQVQIQGALITVADGTCTVAHVGRTRCTLLRDGAAIRLTAEALGAVAGDAQTGDPTALRESGQEAIAAGGPPRVEGVSFRLLAGDRMVALSEGAVTKVRASDLEKAALDHADGRVLAETILTRVVSHGAEGDVACMLLEAFPAVAPVIAMAPPVDVPGQGDTGVPTGDEEPGAPAEVPDTTVAQANEADDGDLEVEVELDDDPLADEAAAADEGCEFREFLGRAPLFAGLGSEAVDALLQVLTPRQIDACETLCREGARDTEVHLVVRGSLALTRAERFVGYVGPRRAVGLLALVGGAHVTTARAVRPSVVWSLPRQAVLDALAPFPADLLTLHANTTLLVAERLSG